MQNVCAASDPIDGMRLSLKTAMPLHNADRTKYWRPKRAWRWFFDFYAAMRWLQGRHSSALRHKIGVRHLTARENIFSTPPIRADVGLAGSGRRVLEFAPNKVLYSTLIRDCSTHDAPRNRGILCFCRVIRNFAGGPVLRIDGSCAGICRRRRL